MIEHMRDLPKDHSKRKDWWFVDRNGRKIGYLWPEDFRAMIDSVWGAKSSVQMFARYAGFTTKTVYDWAKGDKAVPKDVAQLLTVMQQLLIDRKAQTRAHPWRELPPLEADWINEDRQDDKFDVPPLPHG